MSYIGVLGGDISSVVKSFSFTPCTLIIHTSTDEWNQAILESIIIPTHLIPDDCMNKLLENQYPKEAAGDDLWKKFQENQIEKNDENKLPPSYCITQVITYSPYCWFGQ